SISMNVKMGIRHNLKNGKVHFCYRSFLGYRKGADGNPEIVPEEAEIIRRIYRDYLLSKTLQSIAKELNNDGIPKANGKTNWKGANIMSILRNEKYKGDALLQKTYVADCISKKTKKNNDVLCRKQPSGNY
ncbi:MAG: recombinase family protein, partial [Clostridia bacterium]|nr:recombinase family protein [Clostridia bacterium]